MKKQLNALKKESPDLRLISNKIAFSEPFVLNLLSTKPQFLYLQSVFKTRFLWLI